MTADELAAGRERMLMYSRREQYGLTPLELRVLLSVMAYDRAYGLDVPRKTLSEFLDIKSPSRQIEALIEFGAVRMYKQGRRAYIQATRLAWERLGFVELTPEYLRQDSLATQSAA